MHPLEKQMHAQLERSVGTHSPPDYKEMLTKLGASLSPTMAHTHLHLPQSPAIDVAPGPHTHLDFRFELVPFPAALPAGTF